MIRTTERQTKVLDFITGSISGNGRPPTMSEIACHFGFKSDNAAMSHVQALQKKKLIKITPRITRGIRLTTDEPSAEGQIKTQEVIDRISKLPRYFEQSGKLHAGGVSTHSYVKLSEVLAVLQS